MQHTAAPGNRGLLVQVAVAKWQKGKGMRRRGMLDQEPAVEFHPHGHTILLMVLESAQQKHYFISQKSYHPNQGATSIQRLQLQPSKCMLHVRKPSNTCWWSPHTLRCTAVACKRPYSHHLDQQQGYECLSRRHAEKIKYTIQHNNLIKYLSIHATGSDKLTIDKLKTNLDVNTWRLHWNIIPCSEDSSLLLSLEFCHQLCNQITWLSQLLCIRHKEQR